MSEKSEYTPILEKCRQHFIATIEGGNPIYPLYPEHARQVENWVDKILPYFPEADREVVFVSAWLHDIGWADGDLENDHAVKSEKEALRFLAESGYPDERTKAVAHCVRSHRCRDVMPDTIEAKILVAADSASHLTDAVYLIMLSQPHLTKEHVLAKLDRDHDDVSKFLPDKLMVEIEDFMKPGEIF